MKVKPFVFIAMLFAFSGLNAQLSIVHLDELTYSYDNVLKFKNDSFGIHMNSNGSFLTTQDTGRTWSKKQIPFDLDITDFQFLKDSIIIATGFRHPEESSSDIIISLDLGANWESLSEFAGKQLWSVNFFNPDSGLVAGFDGIYHTRDAGAKWDTVWSVLGAGYQYGEVKQISFSSDSIGYAIGMARNQGSESPFFDYFMLKTTDAGISWRKLNSFDHGLGCIFTLNDDVVYIGADNGFVMYTLDGGENWAEQKVSDRSMPIESVFFPSENNGFAVGTFKYVLTGGGRTTYYTLAKTTDGGQTWASIDTLGVPLRSVYFLNDTLGFVSGDYDLIMRTNGAIRPMPENYPWYLAGGVGIDEKKFSVSKAEIFPNPAGASFSIRTKKSGTEVRAVYLYDSTGKIIRRFTPGSFSEIIHISLHDVNPGMYLIRIEYLKGIQIEKIVIK